MKQCVKQRSKPVGLVRLVMASDRVVDASIYIEGWGEAKQERLTEEARHIIDWFDLTLEDVGVIEGFQCIGTPNDIELIEEIKDELHYMADLERELDNEEVTV
tara:strand:- start:554 stop:862 length:309 start_codon:yes stop_codon:yes gene_type:complete